MFRRTIASLVLLGFIAGQLAAVPHAHAGLTSVEQREHDRHPHVHVVGGPHSHGHDHGPLDGHEGEGLPKSSSAPADDSVPCSPHDADAIYLPTSSDWPTNPIQQRTDLIGGAAALACGSIAVVRDWEVESKSESVHPPDSLAGGSKIFLKLRTLRI